MKCPEEANPSRQRLVVASEEELGPSSDGVFF
jgi:hypothetical protein